jgi:hypothetical protein
MSLGMVPLFPRKKKKIDLKSLFRMLWEVDPKRKSHETWNTVIHIFLKKALSRSWNAGEEWALATGSQPKLALPIGVMGVLIPRDLILIQCGWGGKHFQRKAFECLSLSPHLAE